MSSKEQKERWLSAIQDIANFSDNEDEMDEIMAFRWFAVECARAILKEYYTPPTSAGVHDGNR